MHTSDILAALPLDRDAALPMFRQLYGAGEGGHPARHAGPRHAAAADARAVPPAGRVAPDGAQRLRPADGRGLPERQRGQGHLRQRRTCRSVRDAAPRRRRPAAAAVGARRGIRRRDGVRALPRGQAARLPRQHARASTCSPSIYGAGSKRAAGAIRTITWATATRPATSRCASCCASTCAPRAASTARPDQIVITSGSQQALFLLSQLLLAPATACGSNRPATRAPARRCSPRRPACARCRSTREGMDVAYAARALSATRRWCWRRRRTSCRWA